MPENKKGKGTGVVLGKKNKSLLGKIKSKKAVKRVGRVLLTIFLIFIITGCIVTGVLTVYVMGFKDARLDIPLSNLKLDYSSVVYANDPTTGKPVEVQKLYNVQNRIWVDLPNIPKNLQNAFIAAEDQRFFEHEGVDWKRTMGSFVNLFVPIYQSNTGGSTITQQLIKNVTSENQVTISRKIKEIMEALNLEKDNSKDEILQAYLNTIPLGGSCYGVQVAAQTYFGKDVSKLTLAECACIASITKNPTLFDPLSNPKENKTRQEYVLLKMYQLKLISKADYDTAMAQKLVFSTVATQAATTHVESYFIDRIIDDVTNDLMIKKGYDRSYAEAQIYSGGLKIYSTMDTKVQSAMESVFTDPKNFPTFSGSVQPESSMIVINSQGQVLGIVGGRGPKTANRVLDRATDTLRSPGSSIKPITVYAPSIEYGLINFSTIIADEPMTININGVPTKWPKDDYAGFYGNMPVAKAIGMSVNTVAAFIDQTMLTPQKSFDFAYNKLGLTSLVKSKKVNGKIYTDINVASMALGSLTDGVSAEEMAGAYEPFTNGGKFTEPYTYTEVDDSDGNVLLQNKPKALTVMGDDTAYIMNQLLQGVTTNSYGTATYAKLSKFETMGKTGTTSDNKDRWFIGATPYYIGACWFGYDQQKEVPATAYNPSGIAWKKVMDIINAGKPVIKFTVPSDVVQHKYDLTTGQLTDKSTNVGIGWYKASDVASLTPSQASPPTSPSSSAASSSSTDSSSQSSSSASSGSSGSSSSSESSGTSGSSTRSSD